MLTELSMEAEIAFDLVCRSINKVRDCVHQHVHDGRRTELTNERYWHHMFSTAVVAEYAAVTEGQSVWDSVFLRPEHPTSLCFRRAAIDVLDADHTREHAIRRAPENGFRRGNLDFSLNPDSPIDIEWKGPTLYSTVDVAEVMLKLLSQPMEHQKVFAAIITSSTMGRANHRAAITAHYAAGLEHAKAVLNVPSAHDSNLHTFIESFFDGDAEPAVVCWGRVPDDV